MAVAVTTIDNVEAALGRSLTAVETTRANYYINAISAFIATYCDQISLAEVEDDIARKQADYYGIVELGGGPISSVTSVAEVGGTEVSGYTFDGTSQVHGLKPFQTVDVTYTHGTDAIPEDLTGVATEAVVAAITLSVAGPLKTRTVGDVTHAYQSGTVIHLNIEQNVLDLYKTTEYSWRLGPHSATEMSYPPVNWFQIGG